MKKKDNKIKENYFYSLIFQLVVLMVPLITTPYLSRVLEADGIGIFSLTTTNVSYFTLIGVMGLGTYGQLEIAKVRDNLDKRSLLFFEIMLARCIMHFFCLVAYIGMLFIADKYRTMYILQVILIIASMLDITWYFQGLEEFKKIAIRNVFIKIVSVFLIFLLVKQKTDLYVYTGIICFSFLLSNLAFYPLLSSYIRVVDFKKLKVMYHIKGSFIFFLPTVASIVMSSLDKTMIGVITQSEVENGYYAQANKIELLCMSFFSSLNIIMRSRITYMFNNDQQSKTIEYLSKSICFVSFLVFPISLGLIAISSNFVFCFFGKGYEKVSILLSIISFSLIFKSHSNCILEQYLSSRGRQKTATIIIWIAAIFNIFFNAFFIPLYQSVGAAIASMFAEFLVLVLALFVCYKDLYWGEILLVIAKYMVSSVIMASLVMILGNILSFGVVSVCIQVFVGCVLYFSLIFCFKDHFIKGILKRSF